MTGAPHILAVSASPRAGRWGNGADSLPAQLADLDEDGLGAFLEAETLAHVHNYAEASVGTAEPFSDVYAKVRRGAGRRGLSNSEAFLAAAMWEMIRAGCEVDYVPLATMATAPEHEMAQLAEGYDGVMMGGPVYFGDRSSIAESFMRNLPPGRGRPFAGVSVGAKRNGGQETSLVYQAMDALADGWTFVGNDAATTSQYGGTGVAGDLGSASRDEYGLKTSRGTGRRLAHVARVLMLSEAKASPKVVALVLADRYGTAMRLAEHVTVGMDATVIDLTSEDIRRCIACDLCPTHHGPDAEYRCVIKSPRDYFVAHHDALIAADLIIPIVYDHPGADSVYQRFIERSRYIRRSDYILRDAVVAPVVVYERSRIGVMHQRMVTAWVRHNTIISAPSVAVGRRGTVTGGVAAARSVRTAYALASRVAAHGAQPREQYNAVGYAISKARDAAEGRT